MSRAPAGNSPLWFISSLRSIFYDFFLPHPSRLAPPPIQLCHFISSLLPVLSGNNKFKIMTAVRVGAGVVHKQEKGGFVISDSVTAIQCQQNTYAALCTMSHRHQSREWKGESEGGGGLKSDWGRQNERRHKHQNYLLSWKCMVSLQPVIYISTEQLTSASASVFSLTANDLLASLSLQSKWKPSNNKIYPCSSSSTSTFSKTFLW